MRTALTTVAFLVLAAFLPAGAQSVDVIVHPDNEVVSVTRAELSKIFFKRLRTWEGSMPAIPVDQGPDSPTREVFTRQVHRRSVVNVEIFWKRMIFSGRAIPPPELPNDAAVVEFVRVTPGAVGYVTAGTVLKGVRKLEVAD